jgi:N,N'-diacetyllegionaminate synthase
LMHCVSKYPCPPEDLQINTVNFFKERYAVPTGFSDHSIGIDSALAAVAVGAAVIEKHFSLGRDLWGSDHKVAMTPDELKNLVLGIRNLEKDPSKKEEYLGKEIVKSGMGDSVKTLQEGEAQFRPFFRKTLIAAVDIVKGTKIKSEMLFAMRPQLYLKGLPSEEYENILSKKSKINISKGSPISREFIED